MILAERYRLTEEIGRGGFGMVFRARQLNMDRDVAIKILPPKFMAVSDVVERFKREARLASRLRHPNTITVHDYGRHENLLYIVMEMLDGQDLADLLAESPTVPVERILHIGRQVLKSLNEAHEHKIIHRDLKPENIFLTRVGGEEDFVKVLDFGIAKMAMSEADGATPARKLTMSGSTVGTPTYMSPEQAAGEEVDPLTDLYALAVIMYEMACGKPPFHGDNPVKIMRSHLFEEVPKFRKEPLRNSRFESVLLKALSKDKVGRFTSAQQFLNALEGSAAEMMRPTQHNDEPPTTEFMGPPVSNTEIGESGLGTGAHGDRGPRGHWPEAPRISSVPDFRVEPSDALDIRSKRTTESLLNALEQDLGGLDSNAESISLSEHLRRTPTPRHLDEYEADFDEAPPRKSDESIPFDSLPPGSRRDRVHEGASGSNLNQISGLNEFGREPGPSSSSGLLRESAPLFAGDALPKRPPPGFDAEGDVASTSSIITVMEPDPDEIILLTQKKPATPTSIRAESTVSSRPDSPVPSGATGAPARSGQAPQSPGTTGKTRPARQTFSDVLEGPPPARGGDESHWSWGAHDTGDDAQAGQLSGATTSISRALLLVGLLALALILAVGGLHIAGIITVY